MAEKRSTSPGAAPAGDTSGTGGPSTQVTMTLTASQVHTVSINREKLSDWHHRLRGKMFAHVVGFFVRCRVEDTHDGKALYKVARVKQVKPDWNVELDLLTTDEIKAGRNNTNYDCISNAKVTDVEFSAWLAKLPAESLPEIVRGISKVEERLRLLETVIFADPAFAAKKKDEKKDAGAVGPAKFDKYTFSNNVMMVSGDGDPPRTATITELLTNAVGQKGISEPDTPRMASDGNALTGSKPRSFEEAVASNSTMVQLSDIDKSRDSPCAVLPDPARLIDFIREAANATYTAFTYSNLPEFCKSVLSVCHMAKEIFAKEPLFLRLESPQYCFGDIHGNFQDMIFFLDQIVAFDDLMLKYTTTGLLFLGDYVDRGQYSLECIMYLLALKVINPLKVNMLRGNHESPEVNGDMDVYGYSSFKYQCLDKFGREKGMEVWIAVNEVFQYMPVIADIDRKIFCVHGGLPQFSGGEDNRLEILSDPNFPRIPVVQCADPTNVAYRMIVNDLLWSDPATSHSPLDKYGFGPNPRGPDIKTFGPRAVDMFCERYGYQYIFRAHQEKADGLRVSDSARVVTIFSTSDYAGHQNGAGCILVHHGKIRLCIKKPLKSAQEASPKGGVSPRTMGKGLAPVTFGKKSPRSGLFK